MAMLGIVFTLCSQCQALGQALVLSMKGEGDLVVLDLFSRARATPLDCGSSPQ